MRVNNPDGADIGSAGSAGSAGRIITDREFDLSLTEQAGAVAEEIKRHVVLGTGGQADRYIDALLTVILINQVTLKLMFIEAMAAQGILVKHHQEGIEGTEGSNVGGRERNGSA